MATKVGERIRHYREGRGLSLRELARRLEMTHSVLSKWERGMAVVDADFLPSISEQLDVPTAAFFEEQDVPRPSYPTLPGDDLAEEFKAFIGQKADRLPPHEQRAVYLAAGIVDTLLARAG